MSSALPFGGEDTVAAIATAPGRSALAVVRITGREAERIAGRLVRPGGGDGGGDEVWPTPERVASLRSIYDERGVRIDHAIVTRYVAPRSFTGEDLVEMSCHGGELLPALVLEALIAAGARLALPGEFTRRAVLNGRIDLLQAEAIGDLIDARSRAAHRVALDQLDRGLSRRVLALRDSFLDLEALIAYDIDFPEEDDGPIAPERIAIGVRELAQSLDDLVATARAGELIREGALVVIAGAPNVGKSSLFNALLGRRRAIVTDVPGTTRDAIEAVIDTGRWPLRLVDTAGVREAGDVVEQLGIEVSADYLSRADIVLACGATAGEIARAAAFARERTGGAVLEVRTKADLRDDTADDAGVAVADGVPAAPLAVSAATGVGLRELMERIDRTLDEEVQFAEPEMPVLMHARQQRAMVAAREEIGAFADAWQTGAVPAPVAAVHLREGARRMEELIGAIDVEDVLGRVFESFCVGK